MDKTNGPSNVFYSTDRSLPVGAQALPPGIRCKLCQCHPSAHILYFKCPLLEDYICVSCCQEEVPKEETLVSIQKHVECPTFEDVKKTCNDCGNNCLKNPQ